MNAQNTPFSLQTLLARVASTRVATPPPIVLGRATIQRQGGARNARTLQSVIDESGELESHSFDPVDNMDTLSVDTLS